MAWKKDKEFTMEIMDNFDFILEEGQNTSINLRKISWNGRDPKLDIRKWNYSDGKESAMKGVGLTDEGANELTAILIENGYGDTARILKALKQRPDWNKANSHKQMIEAEYSDKEDYYDPSQLLFGEDE
jgi:hypothetical protein